MRIAVNLTAVNSPGTRVYSAGLLPELARQAREDDLLVFLPARLAQELATGLPASCRIQAVRAAQPPWRRVLWEQTLLPLELARARADVLFAPMEFAPLLSPCPSLLAVHNPSPHLNGRPTNRLRRRLSAWSCRAAARVVFVSRFSALYLGGRLMVPEAKRVVIYHGTNPEHWKARPGAAAVLRRLGVEPLGYFLFVSQLYRYKGPDVLIEAFARWRQRHGRDQHLLLTGSAPERPFQDELNRLAAKLGVADRVRFLGLVTGEELPALYANATAFVLPTRIETFGQPFVEAMCAGAPIICSDIEVAREVCGEAPLYFPPGDSDALADCLERVVADSGLRASLIARGLARASQFSWEREARETLELLHHLGKPGLRPQGGEGMDSRGRWGTGS